MSCENSPNRFVNLACRIGAGVSRLAGKRAFYAGAVAGASGAVGAMGLYKYLRGRAGGQTDGGRKPQPVPVSAGSGRARPIPGLGRSAGQTRLKAAAIPMRTETGDTFTPSRSYRVMRTNGDETGLALTPYVRRGSDGQPEESDQWGVTHLRSGSLIAGPYGSLEEAHGLAAKLSPLGWTNASMPAAEVKQAGRIIAAYGEAS